AGRSQNSTTLGCATTRGTSNAPWVESCGPSRANSTESLCCAILASDRVRHAATHRSATSAPIRMGGNIFHRLEQRSTVPIGETIAGAALSDVAAFSQGSEVDRRNRAVRLAVQC